MFMDFSGFPGKMRAAQSGSRHAFQELLARLRPWLLAYYRRRCEPADAEDLAQATLLAVFRHSASYDTSAPFLPWLKAIATRQLIDHYRARARRHQIQIDCRQVAACAPASETRGDCPHWDLSRLLAGLTATQSRSIALVKIDGFTSLEAAARLGITEGAVKVSVHRGMRRLQSQFEGRAW